MKPGEVYWYGSDGIAHPHVVVQLFDENSGQPDSVLVCAISTNLKQINLPGNILLEVGEANLPKRSIVLVSRTVVVQPEEFGEYIGSLSEERFQEVLNGMEFVARMTRKPDQE